MTANLRGDLMKSAFDTNFRDTIAKRDDCPVIDKISLPSDAIRKLYGKMHPVCRE
jgi:hypothetical protein